MILLDSDEALATGVAALCTIDPALARLVAGGTRAPLRKREPGLAGLATIVVGQQVSTASAAAIAGRLRALLPEFSAAALLAASDEALRSVGLSGTKVVTLRAIAGAISAGTLDLDALAHLPAGEAHRRLTAVRGIGPWTADIYLLFCLGHPDIFPAGDLALQEAARLLLDLPSRPDAAALSVLAARWQPWRGVAAALLWAYYREAKQRDGTPMA